MGFCAHARDTHSAAVAPPTHAWGTRSPAAVPHPKAAAAGACTSSAQGAHSIGTVLAVGPAAVRLCLASPGLPEPPRWRTISKHKRDTSPCRAEAEGRAAQGPGSRHLPCWQGGRVSILGPRPRGCILATW